MSTFWRCERCEKVRLTDEPQTDVTIDEADRLGTRVASLRICTACVRELSDEAHERGGLARGFGEPRR